jgi:hypothetical protein
MQSNPQPSSSQQAAGIPIRHFYLLGANQALGVKPEYAPQLYFEAKIDISDVRSGIRDTCSVSQSVGIWPMDSDALWTRDMLLPVDSSFVEPGIPETQRLRKLPEFVDESYLSRAESLFLSYLIRYFEIKVYRNSALRIYSNPLESLEDFEKRCIDMLSEAFRRELYDLQHVFVRKLEQVREKYQRASQGFDPGLDFEAVKVASHWKSRMHQTSERITDLFLGTELSLKDASDAPLPRGAPAADLDQRLLALEIEAGQEIQRLLHRYQVLVQTIDDYTIHPNLKDIHLVRVCILWMPAEEGL